MELYVNFGKLVFYVRLLVLLWFYRLTLSCAPQTHSHTVGFGCQGHPKSRSVVWNPRILRPAKLEVLQQSDHDQKELHTGQAFTKTHTGPCQMSECIHLVKYLV